MAVRVPPSEFVSGDIIAIDRDCWVKIIGLVKEKLQFNN
jgi:hypothetical protein